MEHPSDHPFERYIRDKMYSLRRTPSDGLWERIATQQRSVRRRQVRRNRLFGLGGGVLLLMALAWKYRSGISAGSVQNALSPVVIAPIPAPPSTNAAARFPDQKTLPLNVPEKLAGRAEMQQYQSAGRTVHDTIRAVLPDKTAPYRRKEQPSSSSALQTPFSPLIPAASVENTGTTSELPPVDLFTTGEKNREKISLAPAENVPILPVPLTPAQWVRKTPALSQIQRPVLYDIPVYTANRWQYGLSFTGGKLHESGNWQSAYLGAGVQVQYRLTDRIFIFGGVEWMRGACRFDSKPDLSGAPEFSRSQFPHIPPFPAGTAPLLNLHLQSEWSGFLIPIGVTLYRESKHRSLDWLLRPYYKPQFALQRRNRIWAPLTPLDNQLFQAGQHEWRAGWVGAQTGFDYRLSGRLHVELTLNAEQALQPVGLEQVNYQAFSLRLALLRR